MSLPIPAHFWGCFRRRALTSSSPTEEMIRDQVQRRYGLDVDNLGVMRRWLLP